MKNNIPRFFYGTAWKEERTEQLTLQALEAGFTAIDTANQRRHYYEEAVGRGLQTFLERGTKKREDLFIQTKYTYARGQDHRKPYDEKATFTEQVRQSIKSSFEHLGTDYLDSFLLHGPFGNGVSENDLEVWSAMEELLKEGKTKLIGVSNFEISQLKTFYKSVTIKPSFVQNRCYANMGWDKEVREFCIENKIFYQGFSLLTANRNEIMSPSVQALAAKYKKTIPQIIFRFSQQIGIIPLTGTSNTENMKSDLAIDDFSLTDEDGVRLLSVSQLRYLK